MLLTLRNRSMNPSRSKVKTCMRQQSERPLGCCVLRVVYLHNPTMPGGPFPPCMAGSAASVTCWDESCHSLHSLHSLIPHWESSCFACVRANCPVVPPATTNGSNPCHYQRQISLLCLILQSPNWNNSIQVLHVKPIENEGFLLPLKVVPSVWNRQHLQQAAMAVQGPESQATKQLVSVPAPKK